MKTLVRFPILVAAVMMQACLGATYSWSIYAHFLSSRQGLPNSITQIPFTAFYTVFPATMVAAGWWLAKLGPRGCAMCGGLIFGSGWVLASFGQVHFSLTIIGIGILAGVGVGMAYVVPISVAVRWFPDHKGLVTGVAVAGFGGGAALVSSLGERLMTSHGYSPFDVFRLLGCVFALLVVSAGSLMRYPSVAMPSQNPKDLDLAATPTRDILVGRLFRLLYVAMLVGLAAGFTINANLKQICPAADARAGATAVAIFALANAAGRVGWGLAFDHLLPAAALRANLLLQSISLLAAPMLMHSRIGLWILAALVGFNYGGVLVLYASTTARSWGVHRVGQVYGWLFSSNIPASIAPMVAALLSERLHTFTPALLFLSAALVLTSEMVRRKVSTVVER